MKFTNEIDQNAPLTKYEKASLCALLLQPLLFALLIGSFCSGCKTFYENSGANIDVGDTTVPLKLKEPISQFDLEFLFTLTGARVWTAKDSNVKVNYRNTYTNNYLFGLVDKKGVQDFEVDVVPVSVNDTGESPTDESPTNESHEQNNAAPAASNEFERENNTELKPSESE